MSSGSLGRLSEGADGGPNGEDENKDGQGAPELDGGKAGRSRLCCGCHGGVGGLGYCASGCCDDVTVHDDMEDKKEGRRR